MKQKMYEDVFKIIHNMDNRDLKRVIELVQSRRSILSREALFTFKIGDEVMFERKSGGNYTGVVTKINRKRIVVDDLWSVSPTMLQAI